MATQLPFDKAILRIQDNDARFNVFVNGKETDTYTTTENELVPSITNFLNTKGNEIEGRINNTIATIVDNAITNGGGIVVDYTAPPTPKWKGVEWSGGTTQFPSVIPGFAHIYIRCDEPVYPEGRAHLKSILYGVRGTGTYVFADAAPVGEFTGDFYPFPTDLDATWNFWLSWVTVDYIESVVPAGGLHGVRVATTKLANADIAGLVFEASQLADGSVSASKLAAQAIDATKFANGIEPITVITTATLPTVKSTTMVFFQGKLYKWIVNKYSSEVAATDIAGTIKSAQLNNAVVQLEDGTTVVLSDAAANSQVPTINFIGNFATQPNIGTYKRNSVYKNTTDNDTYILSGTPLTWGLYLESGLVWDIKIESSNGTVFRVGQFSHTMLIAHVFKNGVDVTGMIQDSRFRWRRVSYVSQPPPFDDTTWNLSYSAGYKQIQVSVDEVLARATFHCDIFDS